jgi:hypothetical protein
MKPMIKSKHGGKRKGAGMKAKDGAKGLKTVQVVLTDGHVEKARAKGEGNVSLGIRRAIDEGKEK